MPRAEPTKTVLRAGRAKREVEAMTENLSEPPRGLHGEVSPLRASSRPRIRRDNGDMNGDAGPSPRLTGEAPILLTGLVERLRELLTADGAPPRLVVGITGPPGAGKSTLVTALETALRQRGLLAGIVPMDGFHMSNAVLAARGIADHKGAPDTFDVGGYMALLGRVRRADSVVLAPDYRRDLHEPVAASLPVEVEGVVITEGNYLGLELPGWADVRGLIDLLVYIDTPFEELASRLIDRHVSYGRDRADAGHWVRTVDAANMALVERTKERAELVLSL